MTNAERVLSFLQSHSGQSYCDRCISELTGVNPPNQVNQITRPLALAGEFDRSQLQCRQCGQPRTCSRHLVQ